MRTIKELLKFKGKVIICLSSDTLSKLFQKNAEAEGFTFGDGTAPTSKEPSDLFVLGRDLTISCPGFCGHLAFKTKAWRSPVPVVYIDYGKYVSGNRRYVIRRVKSSKGLLRHSGRQPFGFLSV